MISGSIDLPARLPETLLRNEALRNRPIFQNKCQFFRRRDALSNFRVRIGELNSIRRESGRHDAITTFVSDSGDDPSLGRLRPPALKRDIQRAVSLRMSDNFIADNVAESNSAPANRFGLESYEQRRSC
ncbi:hypothetical protein K0M31_013382 [Melipona bicolor]|uniref:Uncharacterized protein n=1 Tax=Melipona bicolor TaxID=60889 RepID=A0AA40KGP5_9HYME|nr:hypothetical protein K0M31_013382 [Melipona bicolor]